MSKFSDRAVRAFTATVASAAGFGAAFVAAGAASGFNPWHASHRTRERRCAGFQSAAFAADESDRTLAGRCFRVAMNRLGRRLAIAGLAAAASIGSVFPARAHGPNLPHHQVRGVECVALSFLNQMQLRAYPPSAVRSWHDVDHRRAEQVLWRPIVYRYNENTGQWQLYDARAGWTSAFTSSFGFYGAGWVSKVNAGQLQFVPFFVPAGTYTVLHTLHWASTGVSHEHWAPNSCRF